MLEGMVDIVRVVSDLPMIDLRRYELRGGDRSREGDYGIYPSRYTRGDYYKDWVEVTRGRPNSASISVVINRSNEIVRWLRSLGVELDFMTSLALGRETKYICPQELHFLPKEQAKV